MIAVQVLSFLVLLLCLFVCFTTGQVGGTWLLGVIAWAVFCWSMGMHRREFWRSER